MSTLTLRRMLLMIASLVLLQWACQAQSIAGPNIDDTHPDIGEFPQAVEPLAGGDRCTGWDFEMADPCDPGECTPDENAIVPWSEASPGAPEFTWTYPCNPDGYRVALYDRGDTLDDPFVELASDEITVFDPAVGGPRRSWHPDVDLEPATAYSYSLEPYRSGESPSSTNGSTHFWTGPVCEAVPTEAPTLTEPEDGHVFTVTEPQTSNLGWFTWGFPESSCLVDFEGQIAADEAFTNNVIPIVSAFPLERYGTFDEALTWCGTYYWHVRANGDAGPGPWSEARSFSLMPSGGTAACSQMRIEAVARENLACRVGPGTFYAILAYVPAGERRPVEGRNADGTWIAVTDKESGRRCYINNDLLVVEVAGTPFPGGADVGSLLSTLPDPPLPTPKPTEEPRDHCSSSLTKPQCEAGGWPWNYDLNRCNCP